MISTFGITRRAGQAVVVTNDVRLTFPRFVDVPFEDCVAALPRLLHREIRGGAVGLELRRGFMSRSLPMELQVNRWSRSRTLIELVPLHRVRPGRRYFKAGHALLDDLQQRLTRRAGYANEPPMRSSNLS